MDNGSNCSLARARSARACAIPLARSLRSLADTANVYTSSPLFPSIPRSRLPSRYGLVAWHRPKIFGELGAWDTRWLDGHSTVGMESESHDLRLICD